VENVVMQNSSDKAEKAPPSYTSCVPDNVDNVVVPSSSGLEQFVRIVGNHETLHFHSPNRMGFVFAPPSVQIRDSSENPILSVINGRNVVSSGRNRVLSSRELISPNGESLITISTGNPLTLSAGDQILGMLEDDNLTCRQTVEAKNVMGDVIFQGAGDTSIGDSGCNCCLECGFGCCCPNVPEFTFFHNGNTLGKLSRSTNNSSGNELVLFNSANMDPRTKALLIYAGYSAYLTFFVDTKCGRIGERGACRRLCCILLIFSLLLMSIPILIFHL